MKRQIDENSVGGRIHALLKQQKMSQKQLAQAVSATEASISRYIVNERVPKTAMLRNIAEVLHTTPEYLETGVDRFDELKNQLLRLQVLVVDLTQIVELQREEALRPVKVLKHGEPKHHIFTCRNCGCEFEAEEKEWNEVYDLDDDAEANPIWLIECPDCGKPVDTPAAVKPVAKLSYLTQVVVKKNDEI